jgi:hypothetical protein
MKKRNFLIKSAMLIVTSTFILSSCDKDDTPAPSNTITDIVVSS